MINNGLQQLTRIWPILIFIGGAGWAGVSLHFNGIALSKELKQVRDRVETQISVQDERQRKINKYMREQALRNGRMEANQKIIENFMREIYRALRQKSN
jgi:hypothetical protein